MVQGTLLSGRFIRLKHSLQCGLKKDPFSDANPFNDSIFPHCINESKNLSLEFRELRSVSHFKTRWISLVRPVQGEIYGIHDPCGVCRLTQLRVGSSPLREDITSSIPLIQRVKQITVFKLPPILCCSASICASHGVDCNMLMDEELFTLLFYGNDALVISK